MCPLPRPAPPSFQVMWLLRNPVTLLLIIGFGLFLRAVYQNLDVDTAMAMGVVPGLIFLGTKVGARPSLQPLNPKP